MVSSRLISLCRATEVHCVHSSRVLPSGYGKQSRAMPIACIVLEPLGPFWPITCREVTCALNWDFHFSGQGMWILLFKLLLKLLYFSLAHKLVMFNKASPHILSFTSPNSILPFLHHLVSIPAWTFSSQCSTLLVLLHHYTILFYFIFTCISRLYVPRKLLNTHLIFVKDSFPWSFISPSLHYLLEAFWP